VSRRGDSTLTRALFPEEIVEGGTRIKTSSVHGTSGIVCFPLDRSSSHKKIAGVSDIFFRDSFRNRLRTFELSTRVKIAAILAGPQIGTAFRARAFQTNFHGGRDDGTTHRTPQNLLETRHMHGPRTIPLLTLRGTGLGFSRADHTIAAVVLVPTLPVFSFGHLWVTTSGGRVRLQAEIRLTNQLRNLGL
jgi:hypothetical protein